MRCHALAKYQQAVEKALKALTISLRVRWKWEVYPGRRHRAEPLILTLVRFPRSSIGHRDVQGQLSKFFDPGLRSEVRRLDELAPSWPDEGMPHLRNTEYPYNDPVEGWLPPCEPAAFSPAETEDHASVSSRVVRRSAQWISSIERRLQ